MVSVENSYGVIYKTINLSNNKEYIGQTIQKGGRFTSYLGSGLILKQAIKKYGKNMFSKEILEYCSHKNRTTADLTAG